MLFSLVAGAFQAPVAAAAEENGAYVTVIGENNEVLVNEKRVELSEQSSALDILTKAVDGDVVTSDQDLGKSLDAIKGLAKKDTFYWAFYVNQFFSSTSSENYTAQNGDHLTFRYEDWEKASNSATIKVIGKNDETLAKTAYPVSYLGEATALQFLQNTIGKENVGFDDNRFLKINGIQAEGTYYWAFYVNDEYAQTGADTHILQPNNKITFKYESWEQPSEEEPGEEPSEEPVDEEQTPAKPIPAEVLQNAVNTTLNLFKPEFVGSKEAVVLNKLGKAIPADYLANVTQTVIDKKGYFRNITDVEGHVLGIVAAGGDPTNVAGYNLISSIYNGDVSKPGFNGVAYALIALDSKKFEIPASATWTREKLVNYLIENQDEDGSWKGADADVDITAMVLQSLAPYQDQPAVSEAIAKGVENLSTVYRSGDIDNSNTTAQVIIALSALGIDPNGVDFTKDGVSVLAYLLTFQTTDGFAWKHGLETDMLATSQSLQALVAYQLYVEGKGSLFDLSVTPTSSNPVTPSSPETVQPTTAAPSNDNNTETAIASSQNGKALPNTATNSYNTLALGLLIILVGVGALVLAKRRQA